MPLPSLTDREIVLLYREWSESTYAASFYMLPKNGTLLPDFLAWVEKELSLYEFEDYEKDLIKRWRKAEGVA